jgi:hypothetical protein
MQSKNDEGSSFAVGLGVALAALAMPMGCSSSGVEGGTVGEERESVASLERPVVWNPGAALLNEHAAWHSACGSPGARRCPVSGEEFLTFHRDYLHRLRAEHERQGRAEDITPWYTLPAAMKNTAAGWTPALQSAENALMNLIDPSTGQPFASLERFGTYLEGRYHNFLHGLAANAFSENAVRNAAMSPSSTYFFKIHGLVEWHYQRFERGDWNKDGKPDLVVRNLDTGANQVWRMNGTSVVSKTNLETVGTGGCNWNIGATADFDFDGDQDLVWHGPQCNGTSLWRMNGFVHAGDVALPSVDPNWTLIGSGDFNADGRPDLVWSSLSTVDVDIWIMNGPTYVRSITVDIPTGYQAVAVADVDRNGTSDFILGPSSVMLDANHAVQYMRPNGVKLLLSNNVPAFRLGPFTRAAATGRFHPYGNSADVLLFTVPSAPGLPEFQLARQDAIGTTPSYTRLAPRTILALGERIQGPR